MRSPLFDLEKGSHHIMVQNYSQLDEVSHLSDPTGIESTPHKAPQRRLSFLTPKTRTRIRKPWSYLKRVVQRQNIFKDPPPDDRQDDQALHGYMRVHTAQEPSRYKSLPVLLSPMELPHESDPLLIFDQSPRIFSHMSPNLSNKELSETGRTDTSTLPHVPTNYPKLHPKFHLRVAAFLYILLVMASGIDLLGLAASLQTLILGIGTVLFGIYFLATINVKEVEAVVATVVSTSSVVA